uniref:Uncharacterized protein n=1 Tax=Anguilla anguilla TaxID=7936 RepID=A0A0E9Q673_ANGAN
MNMNIMFNNLISIISTQRLNEHADDFQSVLDIPDTVTVELL